MKTILTAAVLALVLMPTVLRAACSSAEHASSCKEGYLWDEAKLACVAKPSS